MLLYNNITVGTLENIILKHEIVIVNAANQSVLIF